MINKYRYRTVFMKLIIATGVPSLTITIYLISMINFYKKHLINFEILKIKNDASEAYTFKV